MEQAMAELMETVRRSRFLADLSPFDRDPWRTAIAIPAGMLAGAVAGLLGALSAILVFMLIVSGLDGASAAMELFRVFSETDLTEPTGRDSLFILAALAGVNLGAAIGFVAAAGAIHHRRIRDYVNDGQPLRWRLMVGGLVLVGLVMLAVTGAAVLTGQSIDPPVLRVSPNLVGRSLYAVIAVALLVLASAAEELVFRGWLLKQSAAYVRNPIALMALNGLLFAAIHLDPNLDAFLVRAAMGAEVRSPLAGVVVEAEDRFRVIVPGPRQKFVRAALVQPGDPVDRVGQPALVAGVAEHVELLAEQRLDVVSHRLPAVAAVDGVAADATDGRL
jgi:membrane protease YdiL (CAAX protease family)